MDIATPTARRSLREPISALALFAGGLAWIASFWFPAFYTSQGAVEGYWVFATGWMGFAIFQFAWYANLLLLLGITLMYSSPLRATVLAGLGMIVATQAFWFTALPTGEVDIPILQFGQGFWCWYGSMLALGIGVFLGSEQAEAENNQTTKKQKLSSPEPDLIKLPRSAALTSFTATSVLVDKVNTELPAESIVQPEPAIGLEPPALNSHSFAPVPEPELTDFAELNAAYEQAYFQVSNEGALTPIYKEHLAEDWPAQISLVVSPDPFTTEPHLETKPAAATTQPGAEPTTVVSVMPSKEPQASSAAFFDPWKT